MGKTKTAVISELPEQSKSTKALYEEKKRKQAEKLSHEQKSRPADKVGKKQVTKVGLKGGERIKVVGAEIPTEIPKSEKQEKKVSTKTQQPRVRGKKYKTSVAKVDKNKLYHLDEAIKLIKETSYSAFDGTVELHLVVKKENLSANVEMPYSAGKEKKIEIANADTLKKLNEGKIDFDVLFATADMMPRLVPFAKLLGPKGLMPNPKSGTLIKNKNEAKKISVNTLSIKTEKKAPLIHTVIGKVSQKEKELSDNALAIINAVDKKQIMKAYLTATMAPSVKLAL